ncbi:MAG: hypothetical protein R3322_17380, partial [Kiloniellales bacterium]|nr:hypothetical protein [Kiloniellales bacterium]
MEKALIIGAEPIDLAYQFPLVGIDADARHLAAEQVVLQRLPVVNGQQVGVDRAEVAAQVPADDPKADLDLLGQEDHAVLEEPGGHLLHAI